MGIKQAGILQIAYKFPPVKSIGALRNYNIAQQFRQHFGAHYVITTRNRDFMLADLLPDANSFDIYPVRTFDFRTLLHRLGRQSGHFRSPLGKSAPSALDQIKDSFPTNLLLDEGGLLYLMSAYRQAVKLIKARNISYIYSSYRPYADHLVAWLLKRRFPHLYWLADFRDPHVDLNRHNVYWPALQHAFNRRIIARADKVVTVSQGLARYLERYGKPVEVLRNGVNPAFFPPEGNSLSERFTIAYTGSIYPSGQTAMPLLEILGSLLEEGLLSAAHLQLRYAGKDQTIWDAWAETSGLSAINSSNGLLNLEGSLAIQRSSHLNLLLTWSGPHIQGILTGKLYEYLAAQRPILALVQGGYEPELDGILQSVRAGFAHFSDAPDRAGLRHFILERYAAWQKGERGPAYGREALEAYTWEAMMAEFVQGLAARDK